ncbi:MAG: helix-turn-helix transcriptional regulator [Clostridia bacterium]|nr:helix-turn-helix transcriptional regulator [Clostridia bacterium]
MQLDLGTRIRHLRRRDSRTQEALATALGVTAQAVSRWEANGSYPDMNLLPAIANYFNVTIDELFGYTDSREKRLDALIARIQAECRAETMDACLALAREAMVEFPGNARMMLCLASVLYQAGYARHGEHHLMDTDGYTVYDTQRHSTYAEWREAIVLYEKALPQAEDIPLRRQATRELSQLYVNIGAYEKALALADAAPDIWGCREVLRINACDGRRQARACGEALLATVRACAELMVQSVLINQQLLTPEEKVQALQSALGLFRCMCPDGNYGEHHAFIGKVHMLLSAYLWLSGKKEEAFAALGEVSRHFKAYEALSRKGGCTYTAALVRLVKANVPPMQPSALAALPEDWPWWSIPEAATIKAEMRADPRWDAWVAQLQA